MTKPTEPRDALKLMPTTGPEYWRKQHHRMAEVLRTHVIDVLRCEAKPHVIADAIEAVREAARMIESYRSRLSTAPTPDQEEDNIVGQAPGSFSELIEHFQDQGALERAGLVDEPTPDQADTVARLVEQAYREGYRDSRLHGGTREEDRNWSDSRARQALATLTPEKSDV